MKMIKESNKRTYIFWGAIILAIIAVILFFVLPRSDYYQPFNNCIAVSANTNEVDSANKSLDIYCVEVLSYSQVSITDRAIVSDLVKLQSTLQLSDNLNRKALAFVIDNAYYKTLSQQQNSLKSTLMIKIDNFQAYCKTTLTSNLENLPNAYNTAEIMQVFIEKYTDLITAYSNFYSANAQLIEKCAQKCLEVNDMVITAHKNITAEVVTILEAQSLNSSQINNLLTTAQTQYSSTYYLTYFN